MSGGVRNQDSYMKGKIAQRYFYDRLPVIVRQVMDRFYDLTGIASSFPILASLALILFSFLQRSTSPLR